MSLRAAINAHCKWCCYDPKSGLGNWRQQVTACQITRCALWPVRPTSKSKVHRGAETAPEQDEREPPEPDGECFRGVEAAAYEAEEMARIQRELK